MAATISGTNDFWSSAPMADSRVIAIKINHRDHLFIYFFGGEGSVGQLLRVELGTATPLIIFAVPNFFICPLRVLRDVAIDHSRVLLLLRAAIDAVWCALELVGLPASCAMQPWHIIIGALWWRPSFRYAAHLPTLLC